MTRDDQAGKAFIRRILHFTTASFREMKCQSVPPKLHDISIRELIYKLSTDDRCFRMFRTFSRTINVEAAVQSCESVKGIIDELKGLDGKVEIDWVSKPKS